ncbi:hypothetical protein LX15_002064 [Streptoalloteichus tenebrarius]|uniref:Uncharacterized protein n=1 Tax=Streptoalloteichus tenebrarius (strain ATCC 17920 / DSM 40477 / JCM 4838 / CBS 697.72 / NBRC 16177 / NCIMB 11028 / NRRL B-12390 / A12253. 1 / ISP 5477) TaxID=1933 RepID=A0ABT1HS75_STRSD|nr:hypothetical protein [Streptoalloteichus tenebrarius]
MRWPPWPRGLVNGRLDLPLTQGNPVASATVGPDGQNPVRSGAWTAAVWHGTRIASITVVTCGLAPRCPAVTSSDNGRQRSPLLFAGQVQRAGPPTPQPPHPVIIRRTTRVGVGRLNLKIPISARRRRAGAGVIVESTLTSHTTSPSAAATTFRPPTPPPVTSLLKHDPAPAGHQDLAPEGGPGANRERPGYGHLRERPGNDRGPRSATGVLGGTGASAGPLRGHQPRSASRCGSGISSTLMPTMASPRPRDTLAITSGSS